MNHDFIEDLMELYNEIPELNPEIAARRVAVLIEMTLRELEKSGTEITRESLRENFSRSLLKHKKAS